MGMSIFVGTAATVFLVSSLCLSKSGLSLLITIPFLYTSIILFIITIASHTCINLPSILNKNPKTGKFPKHSLLFFSPFLSLSQLYFHFKRMKRKDEPLYNEICDGLFLGGWPRSKGDMPPGDISIIDCTCDLPYSNVTGTEEDYICIGAFDTRAPLPAQIELAVRWACAKKDAGKKIYIHCAFGHGRSACVMCALLVRLGIADSWKEAEKIISGRRKIKMNRLHRSALEEWSKIRDS